MSTSPLRVCLVAENVSRCFGGEAILPYHYFRILLRRGVDVQLVVHERVREELQELFPNHLDRLHFVKDQYLQKIFFRVGRLLPRRMDEAIFSALNQLLTQFAQRRVVRSLCNATTVVHQSIPVSPRAPSLLYGLGAPLVCGPLNGGMEYPPSFRGSESWLTRSVVGTGRALTDYANTLLPGKKRAAIVLVANERTRAALPRGIRGRVLLVPENGVDLTQWQMEQSTISTTGPKLVFIGRLVDWKALDILIEALASVPQASIDVVGDGPMMETWRQLAIRLCVSDRIRFRGWLTQPQAANLLRDARALVLPSIYESGGAVVLEAMAMGKPVIATRWGGPVDYLDEHCGFLIPPDNRDALVSGFADAMRLLLDNPDLAARMGEAGRTKAVEYFDWEKKVDTIMGIYNSVLAARCSRYK